MKARIGIVFAKIRKTRTPRLYSYSIRTICIFGLEVSRLMGCIKHTKSAGWLAGCVCVPAGSLTDRGNTSLYYNVRIDI